MFNMLLALILINSSKKIKLNNFYLIEFSNTYKTWILWKISVINSQSNLLLVDGVDQDSKRFQVVHLNLNLIIFNGSQYKFLMNYQLEQVED